MAKNRSEYNKKYWAEHKEEIAEQRKKFYKEHNSILHKQFLNLILIFKVVHFKL